MAKTRKTTPATLPREAPPTKKPYEKPSITNYEKVPAVPVHPPASIWRRIDSETEALEIYEGTNFQCTILWHKGAMITVGCKIADLKR